MSPDTATELAKMVTYQKSIGVGRLEVGLLAPDAAVADEDVRRAGTAGGAVVGLVPVDARGVAVLRPRPTTTVSPDTATEKPNRSSASVLDALR